MHRISAANTATFNTASIIRDRAISKFEKFLGLIEREALCAYRWHNINGTEQCKTISNLLDLKLQPTG
jgi:hypothetical protein